MPTLQADNGLDYAALLQAGLALAQTAAADSWTDYNLHDPGVTLLEQLCYGLTDIAYRIDFPVADHLSGPGDIIAYGSISDTQPKTLNGVRVQVPSNNRVVVNIDCVLTPSAAVILYHNRTQKVLGSISRTLLYPTASPLMSHLAPILA